VGVALARAVIGTAGVLLLVGGIALAAATGPTGDAFSALFLFVPGALLIAAVILERTRYRSLDAEQSGDGHGMGGGETAVPDARFRATDERFVDPTTRIPMRVFVDPRTGERRYVAER
jgi:hypothetical protein